MTRDDREGIYKAKRAGFVARVADRIGRKRAEAIIAGVERDAAGLGLERGSAQFWHEAERRATPPLT